MQKTFNSFEDETQESWPVGSTNMLKLSIPLRMKHFSRQNVEGPLAVFQFLWGWNPWTWRKRRSGTYYLSIPLRMKLGRYNISNSQGFIFQFLWGWNRFWTQRYETCSITLSIPLRMKLTRYMMTIHKTTLAFNSFEDETRKLFKPPIPLLSPFNSFEDETK